MTFINTTVVVPHEKLSPEALKGLIMEFVTRDGTDYGKKEMPLETKIMQVENKLKSGRALIIFDQSNHTCGIFLKDDPRLKAFKING